jgi:LysR family transcriptional regulator, transcriptional activator of the cysJI operon
MTSFDQIDVTSLKAFYFAAQTSNFTKAQSLAGLTQSGISQHIKKLEERLGLTLFDRSEKKLRLTEAGLKLFDFAKKFHENLSQLFDELESSSNMLKGLVSYAMPASCLKTPHFPMLLNAHPNFPHISLQVLLKSNSEIFEMILNDQVHFGFMTKEIEHKALSYDAFAEERYICVGKTSLIETITERNFHDHALISYPGMETLFEFWRKEQLPKKKNLNLSSLQISGEINDLDGAITMCLHGLGLSIFPYHCVEKELKNKSLAILEWRKSSTRKKIFIVSKQARILPDRVERVLQEFYKMKN